MTDTTTVVVSTVATTVQVVEPDAVTVVTVVDEATTVVATAEIGPRGPVGPSPLFLDGGSP